MERGHHARLQRLRLTRFCDSPQKLNRDGLRWYGIRTVEPHHDGTVHWHMMVFAHPDEIETIVSHVRDIAIQEDRHELGDDITPRFKAEYVDGSKGTPTSYIATYIGKEHGQPRRGWHRPENGQATR